MEEDDYYLIKAGTILKRLNNKNSLYFSILNKEDKLKQIYSSIPQNNIIKALKKNNRPLSEDSISLYYEEHNHRKEIKDFINRIKKDLPLGICKRLDYEHLRYPVCYLSLKDLKFFQDNDVLNVLKYSGSPKKLMSDFFNVNKYKESFYLFENNESSFDDLDLLKVFFLGMNNEKNNFDMYLLINSLNECQKENLKNYLGIIDENKINKALTEVYNNDYSKYMEYNQKAYDYMNSFKNIVSLIEKENIEKIINKDLEKDKSIKRRL